MRYIPYILFSLAIIAVSAFLTYNNWQDLLNEGIYSPKLAVFGPVGVVGGLFMLFFPGMSGTPNSTGQKVLLMFVFAIGVAAGIYNLYLMDPSFFSIFGG